MANVAHSTLSGADLHEPKGVSSAAAGSVYIANGGGSGTWGSIATSLNFVGMVADFAVPVAPTGWLECDGSTISRTTYADLFSAVTVQQSGVRTSGSPVITGLSSTTNVKVGYYVSGSGIPLATTVLSVDSGTQITLSANATSSGTSTVIAGPWALGDGSTTFSIPDLKTSGRYRRSRTSAIDVGISQADQYGSHTHTLTTDGSHNHTATDAGHTHGYTSTTTSGTIPSTGALLYPVAIGSITSIGFASISVGSGGSHTHTVGTSGSSETRPISIVVMTCIKY